MKVCVSYTVDGTIEVDIPEEILTDPFALKDHLAKVIDNVGEENIVNGLNLDYSDAIIVKSVFTALEEFPLRDKNHEPRRPFV